MSGRRVEWKNRKKHIIQGEATQASLWDSKAAKPSERERETECETTKRLGHLGAYGLICVDAAQNSGTQIYVFLCPAPPSVTLSFLGSICKISTRMVYSKSLNWSSWMRSLQSYIMAQISIGAFFKRSTANCFVSGTALRTVASQLDPAFHTENFCCFSFFSFLFYILSFLSILYIILYDFYLLLLLPGPGQRDAKKPSQTGNRCKRCKPGVRSQFQWLVDPGRTCQSFERCQCAPSGVEAGLSSPAACAMLLKLMPTVFRKEQHRRMALIDSESWVLMPGVKTEVNGNGISSWSLVCDKKNIFKLNVSVVLARFWHLLQFSNKALSLRT